tara:strand:+ start:84 stop:743 length:660 start_codon:yes stop_codon:yes gene_type:complete
MLEAKTFIKICGITTINQALQIAELGVDAIGVISVKESPRYVPHIKKEEIFKSLAKFFPKTKRVSVVKNLSLDILTTNFTKSENVIQLHGDENLSYCKQVKKEIPNIELWKAFRIRNKEDIREIELFSNFIDTILLDSWNSKSYGGSGIRIHPKYLEGIKFCKPWLLAGGISLNWIKEVLYNIKPDGIDISSSIECSPGIKDIEKSKELIKVIKNKISI